MKSRILLDVNESNVPCIKVIINKDSDDLKDKLLRRLFEFPVTTFQVKEISNDKHEKVYSLTSSSDTSTDKDKSNTTATGGSNYITLTGGSNYYYK